MIRYEKETYSARDIMPLAEREVKSLEWRSHNSREDIEVNGSMGSNHTFKPVISYIEFKHVVSNSVPVNW